MLYLVIQATYEPGNKFIIHSKICRGLQLMLCPGCVLHGLPQAQRVAAAFVDAPLTVVGLHTVFEHHAVMGPTALDVFLQEYRVRFPVAVDQPDSSGAGSPMTMQAYAMRGTPASADACTARVVRRDAGTSLCRVERAGCGTAGA